MFPCIVKCESYFFTAQIILFTKKDSYNTVQQQLVLHNSFELSRAKKLLFLLLQSFQQKTKTFWVFIPQGCAAKMVCHLSKLYFFYINGPFQLLANQYAFKTSNFFNMENQDNYATYVHQVLAHDLWIKESYHLWLTRLIIIQLLSCSQYIMTRAAA